MAPPDKPLEKKQQALTAFFTPRTAQRQVVAASKRSDVASSPGSPTRKRTLEQVADGANGSLEQCRKRSKIDTHSTQAEKSAYFSNAAVGAAATPDKPPSSSPTARAERFLHASGASRNSTQTENEDIEEDAETKRQNEELHKKFVKKLGHPDAFSWRSRGSARDVAADVEDAEGDDDDEGQTQAAVKKKGAKTGKLTPMEQQFLEIKRQHLDTILIVEVGYKFRFFGEDARIAAKELSIVCIPGKLRYDEHPSEAHLDRFASASIPVHRLPVHAKRLVAAGHKVGVVRQIETAALKKAGDNRNTPFVRKLTNLYTKGTYVDENGELDQKADGSPASGYLLCITETKSNGWGTDEKVDVGILAVQPATGDIIYDDFEDGFMRSEVETRLLHISPCEFLIVGELTMGTEKLVQRLSGSSTNVFGERSRVERVPRSQTASAEAYAHVTQFYAAKVEDAASNDTAAALLDKVLKLPEPVTICLAAMISHLQGYGLEHIFDLTKYFQSFSTRSHMLISGTTLESLEVYRNATDHAEKGSLFWAVDKTLTRFGKRLLRKWVGRPLLSREPLEERLAAVQELLDKQALPPVDELRNLLSSVRKDLERSLIRIYYGKCTRPELLHVLQTLHKIALYYARLKESSEVPFSSGLLTSAITTIPQILDPVASYLGRIKLQAARQDDKYRFFRDEHQTEDVHDHQLSIAHVEHELDAHRAVAAKEIGRKRVEYVTVAGIEYLIEVPNADVRHVPASWAKISGTKKLSRFHTPEVLRLTGERNQHREALSAACDKAFRDLLAEIAADYQPLRNAIAALATLDCLLSLSRVAAQPGYNKPTILPASSEPTISVVQARHPVAEQTLEAAYIPFSTTLAQPRPLAHLITGPNMGGKSSFVRALALVVLLAQIGSFVPADKLSLTLCDTIQTRAGARDNLFAGESTFMIELSETARILRAATPRSLVILDELGRGTSTHDGAAIAEAVLHYVVTESRCLTLFITHYQSLARACSSLAAVSNLHMKFEAHTAADGREDITFLYEVAPGMAHRSYGLNVARLARIPDKVLDMAANQSRELELRMRMRQILGACHGLKRLCSDSGLDQLQHAVMAIEQL